MIKRLKILLLFPVMCSATGDKAMVPATDMLKAVSRAYSCGIIRGGLAALGDGPEESIRRLKELDAIGDCSRIRELVAAQDKLEKEQ